MGALCSSSKSSHGSTLDQQGKINMNNPNAAFSPISDENLPYINTDITSKNDITEEADTVHSPMQASKLSLLSEEPKTYTNKDEAIIKSSPTLNNSNIEIKTDNIDKNIDTQDVANGIIIHDKQHNEFLSTTSPAVVATTAATATTITEAVASSQVETITPMNTKPANSEGPTIAKSEAGQQKTGTNESDTAHVALAAVAVVAASGIAIAATTIAAASSVNPSTSSSSSPAAAVAVVPLTTGAASSTAAAAAAATDSLMSTQLSATSAAAESNTHAHEMPLPTISGSGSAGDSGDSEVFGTITAENLKIKNIETAAAGSSALVSTTAAAGVTTAATGTGTAGMKAAAVGGSGSVSSSKRSTNSSLAALHEARNKRLTTEAAAATSSSSTTTSTTATAAAVTTTAISSGIVYSEKEKSNLAILQSISEKEILLMPPLPRQGYLQKKGQLFHTFVKRYYTLSDGYLNDFETKEDVTASTSTSTHRVKQLNLQDSQLLKDEAKNLILIESMTKNVSVMPSSSFSLNSGSNSDSARLSAAGSEGSDSARNSVTDHSNNNNSSSRSLFQQTKSVRNSLLNSFRISGNGPGTGVTADDQGSSGVSTALAKKTVLLVEDEIEYHLWLEALGGHIKYANERASQQLRISQQQQHSRSGSGSHSSTSHTRLPPGK